jgi:LuxR family maltose regulon positive regulatory protein
MNSKRTPFYSSPDIPEVQVFLERPRVYNILEKALQSYVVTVNAGEGCGKTLAVHSFLLSRPETVIWIQLSERDNYPSRFWENIAKAVYLYSPKLGKILIDIGFPETKRQCDHFFSVLQKETAFSTPVILVFDDCHLITSRQILQFIERFLVSRLPNHTMFLISRTEPMLNTMTLLSKGMLSQISAEDMLFNEQEIAEYFRLYKIPVSGEEISAIYRDTEGWPLALNLITVEMEKRGEKYTRPILDSGVFRILENDVFASLPVYLQNYLIKLSLFEQWPRELLERIALTLPAEYSNLPGQMPGLLAQLDKISALIRFDRFLNGYRIHQVFLDYLREKLKEIPQEEIKEACDLAAKWCMENNLRTDAAINYERAENYAGLTEIANSFPRLIPRMMASFLLEITERLFQSPGRNEEDKSFLYLRYVIYGRLLTSLSRLDEAEIEFQKSIAHFENLPPDAINARILSECYSFMGSLAIVGLRFKKDVPCAWYFQQADFHYKQYPYPVPPPLTQSTVSTYANQIAYPAEAGAFEYHISRFAPAVPHAAGALGGFLTGMDDLARAELAYFKGDLSAADQLARQAVFKARGKNQYEIETRGLFYLLRINLHGGSPEELMNLWKQAETLLANPNFLNRRLIIDMDSGWFYAQTGQPEKIASWLRGEAEESEIFSIFRNFESLVRVKYLYAEKQYVGLIGFLNLEENKKSLGTFLLGLLEMKVVEAAAWYKLGQENEALKFLEFAYNAALSNSLIMPFVEMGEDMHAIASTALNTPDCPIPRPWLEDIRNRSSAYGKHLFLISEQLRNKESEGEKTPVYLTRREQEVLRGLSRGQTREEIADATGQSMAAVKNHISNICTKLGAINRTDAVRIATGLGFLNKI